MKIATLKKYKTKLLKLKLLKGERGLPIKKKSNFQLVILGKLFYIHD